MTIVLWGHMKKSNGEITPKLLVNSEINRASFKSKHTEYSGYTIKNTDFFNASVLPNFSNGQLVFVKFSHVRRVNTPLKTILKKYFDFNGTAFVGCDFSHCQYTLIDANFSETHIVFLLISSIQIVYVPIFLLHN